MQTLCVWTDRNLKKRKYHNGSYEHYSYILMLSSKTIPKVDF